MGTVNEWSNWGRVRCSRNWQKGACNTAAWLIGPIDAVRQLFLGCSLALLSFLFPEMASWQSLTLVKTHFAKSSTRMQCIFGIIGSFSLQSETWIKSVSFGKLDRELMVRSSNLESGKQVAPHYSRPSDIHDSFLVDIVRFQRLWSISQHNLDAVRHAIKCRRACRESGAHIGQRAGTYGVPP